MKNIKSFLVSLAALIGIVVSTVAFVPAYAASPFAGSSDQACAGASLDDTGCTANQGVDEVNSTINTVINLLSFLVGVISVIMIIIGGIRFVTSQGNAQSTASARNTVIFAVVGLVLAIFAQLIVKFVLGKAS